MDISKRLATALLLIFGWVHAQRAPLDLYPKTELTNEQKIHLADLQSLYESEQATERQIDELGQLFLQGRQYKKAFEVYEYLCQSFPNRFEYQFRRGASAGFVLDTVSKLRALSYLSSLKSGFEQAVRINQNSIAAKRALLSVYVDLPRILGGDLQKGLQICADIESLSPLDGALAYVWYASKTNQIDLAKIHMQLVLDSEEKQITVNDSRYEYATIAWLWGGEMEIAKEYFRAFISYSQPGDMYPAVFAKYRLAEISVILAKEPTTQPTKDSILKQFPNMVSWLETFDPIGSMINDVN